MLFISVLMGCSLSEQERLVTIESSRINIKTQGSGNPTVIFENGMGSSMDAWESIPDSIALLTRVFNYDRAGIGKSDTSAVARTVPNMVEELKEVLEKEGLRPPYIYVAHSMGSYLARYYALHYPDEIGALLLVDPSPDQLYDDYTEKEYKEFKDFGEASYAESTIGVQREWKNYLPNRKYVQNDSISNEIPMVIISATQWDFSAYHAAMMNDHKNSRHLKVEGSHDIHQENPTLIIDIIKELLIKSK